MASPKKKQPGASLKSPRPLKPVTAIPTVPITPEGVIDTAAIMRRMIETDIANDPELMKDEGEPNAPDASTPSASAK